MDTQSPDRDRGGYPSDRQGASSNPCRPKQEALSQSVLYVLSAQNALCGNRPAHVAALTTGWALAGGLGARGPCSACWHFCRSLLTFPVSWVLHGQHGQESLCVWVNCLLW